MREAFISASDDAEGLCIGPYIVKRKLGRGAHGVVYLASHRESHDRTVAVKVIEDTLQLDSLLLEPDLLSRLDHSNIVKLEDYFLHAAKLVLVMEYIEGEDLDTYFERRGTLSGKEVRSFLLQIGSAISEAHRHGVIHGDIKPSNIMVRLDGTFVLTDFGVSRIAQGFQFHRQILGTYRFMAPETIRGRPSKESDFWALGVSAYRLLTGNWAFQAQSIEDLRRSIFFDTPPPPAQRVQTVPEDLNVAIGRLLDKDLSSRIGDFQELKGLLEYDREAAASPLTESVGSKGEVHGRGQAGTWRTATERRIKRAWYTFGTAIGAATIAGGIIGPVLQIAGWRLLWIAHGSRTVALKVAGGIALLLLGFVAHIVTFVGIVWAVYGLPVTQSDLDTAANWNTYGSMVVLIVCALVAVHGLAKGRRLKRELLLMDDLWDAAGRQDVYLNTLRAYLDTHYGDLHIHNKYVEGLMAAGRIEQAIVEAKLILRLDPYNFSASLLLAHAYFQGGLLRQCEQVCNGYVALAPQCFEFGDLSRRCRELLGGTVS